MQPTTFDRILFIEGIIATVVICGLVFFTYYKNNSAPINTITDVTTALPKVATTSQPVASSSIDLDTAKQNQVVKKEIPKPVLKSVILGKPATVEQSYPKQASGSSTQEAWWAPSGTPGSNQSTSSPSGEAPAQTGNEGGSLPGDDQLMIDLQGQG